MFQYIRSEIPFPGGDSTSKGFAEISAHFKISGWGVPDSVWTQRHFGLIIHCTLCNLGCCMTDLLCGKISVRCTLKILYYSAFGEYLLKQRVTIKTSDGLKCECSLHHVQSSTRELDLFSFSQSKHLKSPPLRSFSTLSVRNAITF